MATLDLKGVSKQFDDTRVLDNINLNVADGELVVFVGPSGCGKSTLLRLIAGLEAVTTGDVSIGDRDVSHLPPSKRGIAMVFQSYALYPHKTVRGNLGFALKHAGAPAADIKRRVDAAAAILELEDLMDRLPRALSGGQRQRVAIGRAIVREPDVFLFDEPLSNLDAALRVHMRVEILKLHQRLGATMVYVTHDQTEAMTLADRIVVMRDGCIEQVGTPLELYRHPANRFVAGFIGSPAMNFLDAQVREGRVVLGDQPLHPCTRTDGPITLGIRPEHLVQDDDGPLSGGVEVFEHLGGEAFVHITLGENLKVVAKLDGEKVYRPGDTIRLSAPEERCHLFEHS